MSKHWTSILLLVSLAFNLAVLGGFIYMHVHHPPHVAPGDRPPGPHRESGPFHERWKGMESDSIRALRDAFMESKKELMQELAKDPLDEQAINRIITRSITAQSTLERELGAKLVEMRKQMSAEEAKECFSRRFEDRRPRKYRR
jgi:hypothetical protein